MAWIESHQALEKHPKTIQLSQAMGWTIDETIGKLHRFWWWCLDYAADGYLDRYHHSVIASVFLVSERTDELITSLRDSKFVDFEPRFRVHDWWDYGGRYLQVKYKNKPKVWKEIKRLYGHSVQRTKQPTQNRLTTDKTTINQPTDLDQPNLTDQQNQPAEVASEFDTFWQEYPRKACKDDAKKAWGKMNGSRPPIEVILTAIKRHRQLDQWTKDKGKFIPYPASWLNKRRWEDEDSIPPNVPGWQEQFLAQGGQP